MSNELWLISKASDLLEPGRGIIAYRLECEGETSLQ
jgi:hypothetical protein